MEKYFDIYSSVFILGLETVGVSCTVWETLIGEIGYKVCKFDLFYNRIVNFCLSLASERIKPENVRD